MEENLTINLVMQNYMALSSPISEVKHKANIFLMSLVHRDEAWLISKELIIGQNDPNYQVLGAQIMYQKVSTQLHNLKSQLKVELRDFIFGLIQRQDITLTPLIDKLVSTLALVVCTMLFDEWKTFITDLFQFMNKSPNCLKNGLFLLERIPEELRLTNRLKVGLKQAIIDQFLNCEYQMAEIFLNVLSINSGSLNQLLHKQLIKRNLNAMESWSKARFNFLKYTQLIKKVFIQSLQDIDKFEHAIVVIVETIRSVSTSKNQSTVTGVELQKQLALYSEAEIASIKLILSYVQQNKSNFMNYNISEIEPEHRQSFLDIIKQSLLTFNFLLLESIGYQLLEIVIYFTNSNDLKTSSQTFQFWIDIMEKISNNNKIQGNIKSQFTQYVSKLFDVLNSKNIVEYDEMLEDPEMKEEATFDDPNAMTYTDYRKESTLLYHYIYTYLLKTTNSSNTFFQACFSMISKDLAEPITNYSNQQFYYFHKNTELALFCLKSPQESFISNPESQNFCKIIQFLLDNINSDKVRPKPRVTAEILMLIAGCTNQIQPNSALLLQCLKFSLKYLMDQDLCFYSSRAFRNIIQTIPTITDSTLIFNLIEYYNSNAFKKQIILGQILEGVFGSIQKFQNKALVPEMMQKLVTKIYTKFNNAQQYLEKSKSFQNKNQPLFFTPLLEIKTILSCYTSSTNVDFCNYFLNQFQNLANQALTMIANILPYCLRVANLKLLLHNELGFSFSIFKSAVKICGISKVNIESVIRTINQTLSDTVIQEVAVMCDMFGFLSEALLSFTKNSSESIQGQEKERFIIFNNWLVPKIRSFNTFFFEYFKKNGLDYVDPDVIKWFFTVTESLIIYNQNIFISVGHAGQILDTAIYAIRHMNQQKMQRKIVNVLFLCCQFNSQELENRKQKLLEQTFRSVPILNSLCYQNLSKIFMRLFPQLGEEKCAEFIYYLLKGNPYTDISTTIITLIAQSFFFSLKVNNDRYLIRVLKDMQQIAINGEKPQTGMQLEVRLKSWQRQLKVKQNQ